MTKIKNKYGKRPVRIIVDHLSNSGYLFIINMQVGKGVSASFVSVIFYRASDRVWHTVNGRNSVCTIGRCALVSIGVWTVSFRFSKNAKTCEIRLNKHMPTISLSTIGMPDKKAFVI